MIELERRSAGGTVVLRLARPPVNALDLELLESITAGFEQALAEEAAAIVVTGRGRCFSAGIDVKLTPTYTAEERRAAIRAINRMVSVIHGAPVPVVAAVNGHAMGGGLVLALACDMRLASSGEHVLALNEVAAGVPFPAGPLALVHGELAPGVARDLCLTGRSISPSEALELGVVDRLVEGDELLEHAQALAAELASHGAYVVVKRQVRGRLSAELERICAEDDDPLLLARAGAQGQPGG
jgi:enoyl-CoA hydratase